MAEVIFKHSKLPTLSVSVKPNQVAWSYGLNVANFPTYGGEVVQILSCFIEDMTVTGNTTDYDEMEKIYRWFIDYINVATTGKKGNSPFNAEPVAMKYPERGWSFDLYPKDVPGLKYGRDVVAPEWTMIAAVVEPDQDVVLQTMDAAAAKLIESEGDVQLFGKATAEIGFTPENPFSDPLGDPRFGKGADAKLNDKKLKQKVTRSDFSQLSDFYNKLIPSYLQGNFSDLSVNYSKPETNPVQKPNTGSQKAGKNANR